jgi:hypothetical protein
MPGLSWGQALPLKVEVQLFVMGEKMPMLLTLLLTQLWASLWMLRF